MKKRRKVLVALAMAVTMLTPTGISAAEYGQVSGLQNAQEEVQDADGITNDSNELPIVDEKDQNKENPDEPKDNEEKEPIHTGWYQAESGEWYLYDEAGNLKTGWCLQGNTWYYLDGENPEHPGMMTADQIKEINGKYYGFDASGAMQTGWILKEEGWYYAQTDGTFVNGWNNIGGAWYYLDGNNAEHPDLMVAGQQKVIDGNTYFFAETGTMKSGWQQYPEGWYYATPDGAKIYGWRNINNEWYYLDENNIEYPGLMVNDPEKIIDGTTYYFNADGAMVRGWKQYPEGWYYQDPSGVRATGWRRVAGVWYYLDGNNTEYPGLLVTNCSKVINGVTYHFDKAGAMREGWYAENGAWYYYNESGLPASGWKNVNGTWYYLDPQNNNKMVSGGWKAVNGSWYYFNGSGAMAKNWLAVGSDWYYLGEDGAMKTGWQLVGGSWYYMYYQNDSHGGIWGMMAKNRYIDGYYLGASGAMVPTDMAMMTAKAQAYASNTNYLILVNRATCRVGIFNGRLGAWNMSKFWQCAPGAAATPTVSGTFKVQSKGYYFDSGSARCYWYTQFYGNYLFHSVLYNKRNGSLMDGRVGIPLSHGCVRLEIQNAKWIYDNIPVGTKVVVY